MNRLTPHSLSLVKIAIRNKNRQNFEDIVFNNYSYTVYEISYKKPIVVDQEFRNVLSSFETNKDSLIGALYLKEITRADLSKSFVLVGAIISHLNPSTISIPVLIDYYFDFKEVSINNNSAVDRVVNLFFPLEILERERIEYYL